MTPHSRCRLSSIPAYSYEPTGSPWTFGNQAGISSSGSAFGNTAPDGTQVAFVQGAVAGSCLSQPVTGLTIGDSYSFTVSAAERSGTEGGQTIAATLGGASLGSITPASTTFADVTTGAATATATTETLEFCGTVLGDHTVFIDNVRQNNPIIADPGFESPVGGHLLVWADHQWIVLDIRWRRGHRAQWQCVRRCRTLRKVLKRRSCKGTEGASSAR